MHSNEMRDNEFNELIIFIHLLYNECIWNAAVANAENSIDSVVIMMLIPHTNTNSNANFNLSS